MTDTTNQGPIPIKIDTMGRAIHQGILLRFAMVMFDRYGYESKMAPGPGWLKDTAPIVIDRPAEAPRFARRYTVTIAGTMQVQYLDTSGSWIDTTPDAIEVERVTAALNEAIDAAAIEDYKVSDEALRLVRAGPIGNRNAITVEQGTAGDDADPTRHDAAGRAETIDLKEMTLRHLYESLRRHFTGNASNPVVVIREASAVVVDILDHLRSTVRVSPNGDIAMSSLVIRPNMRQVIVAIDRILAESYVHDASVRLDRTTDDPTDQDEPEPDPILRNEWIDDAVTDEPEPPFWKLRRTIRGAVKDVAIGVFTFAVDVIAILDAEKAARDAHRNR